MFFLPNRQNVAIYRGDKSLSDNEEEMTEEEIASLKKLNFQFLFHFRFLQLLIRCHKVNF